MKQNISDLNAKIAKIDSTLLATTSKINFLKDAIKAKEKQVEFENAFSGMSCDNAENHALAWLTGYVPTENAEEENKKKQKFDLKNINYSLFLHNHILILFLYQSQFLFRCLQHNIL